MPIKKANLTKFLIRINKNKEIQTGKKCPRREKSHHETVLNSNKKTYFYLQKRTSNICLTRNKEFYQEEGEVIQ